MKREKAWFEKKLRTPREKLLFQQEHLILRATEELCRTMDEERLSKASVAERIGKSKAFVTQVLSGRRNMTLRTLAELAWACGHAVDLRLTKTSQAPSRQMARKILYRGSAQPIAASPLASRAGVRS